MDARELQNEVVGWADSVFPARTAPNAFLKLFSELGEVIDNPEDESEWADLLILVLDLMAMHGHRDPAKAVLAKLEINKRREWLITRGVMSHKKD